MANAESKLIFSRDNLCNCLTKLLHLTCAYLQKQICTHTKNYLFSININKTHAYMLYTNQRTQHIEKASPITLQTTHIVDKTLEWAYFCACTSQEEGDHTVKCRSLPTKVGMVHGISKANINGKKIDVCNTVRWPNKCPQECSRWMFHKSSYKHASHNGDKPWHAGLWHAKTCVHPNKYVIKVMPMETCTHCYVCCTKSTILYNAPQVLWHDDMTRRLYGDISLAFFKCRRQKKSIST